MDPHLRDEVSTMSRIVLGEEQVDRSRLDSRFLGEFQTCPDDLDSG